jgi:hypothetical protein
MSLNNTDTKQNNKLVDIKQKTLIPDKDGFYSLNVYSTRLRYFIEDETVFFSLSDIDSFLEVSRLDGAQERTENNYTIHHILYDYNIIPYSIGIGNKEHLFLKLPQLIEFCDRFKTKRSLMLTEVLEHKATNYITESKKEKIIESNKKEIEESKKFLKVTS